MLPYSALLALVFTTMFVLDIVVEGFVWMPFGTFTYVGGHMPALFPDAYHRFPLQEAIFAGFLTTSTAFLYHFRNDRGETVVERGIDEVRGSHLKKTGLRLLAMIGAMQVIFFLTYNVPMTAFFGSKAAPWPKDAQERSYLTDGLCGPGTTYSCGGPDIPLPVRSSSHVAPDGTLVVPEGRTVTPTTLEFKR